MLAAEHIESENKHCKLLLFLVIILGCGAVADNTQNKNQGGNKIQIVYNLCKIFCSHTPHITRASAKPRQ